MSVRVRVEVQSPRPLSRLTDARMMRSIGQAVTLLIRRRTLTGRAVTGAAFVPYSTRRMFIGLNSETARRLTPKGGQRVEGGVVYSGGYAQYKRESRRPGQTPQGGAASGPTSEVDLTLSGELMRSVREETVTASSVSVGVKPGRAEVADGLSKRRPFIGVAPGEMRQLEAVVAAEVAGQLKRAGWL